MAPFTPSLALLPFFPLTFGAGRYPITCLLWALCPLPATTCRKYRAGSDNKCTAGSTAAGYCPALF